MDLSRFQALAWEDEKGPHAVEGQLQFVECTEAEPAEFARYSYVPEPPIRISPPQMRYSYVIDGKTYTFEPGQEHKIFLRKEEKVGEYKYADEDGDSLELDTDNTLGVTSSDEDLTLWVDVREENFGPLIYNLLNNYGTETSKVPEVDANTCRSMIKSYAKRLMELQEAEQEEENSLMDLAVILYSSIKDIPQAQARRVIASEPSTRKKALTWARSVKSKLPKDQPKVLLHSQRRNPDTSVNWKCANNKGYFQFRMGSWYFSERKDSNFVKYDPGNFAYLGENFFPMTED